MFGSDVLDVAVGLIFVYLLVSVLCSAIREGLEAWLKTRAAYLEHGIRELLHANDGNRSDAKGLVEQIYKHPLINGLFSGNYETARGKRPRLFSKGGDLPSYIPSKNFAMALMDLAARGPVDCAAAGPATPVISLDSIRSNVKNIPSPDVQRVLLTALDSAQGSLDRAQQNIEAWYDSGMDRVSGWYKRSTQWIIFMIGLIVAVGMNVNTLVIVDYLYVNDAARAAIVARAEKASANPTLPNQSFEQTKKELNELQLPIGWEGSNGSTNGPRWGKSSGTVWVTAVFGWLLTAFAASMGAPFWFDLLNKVMVIRSTVKPHEKSPEESSEDRQKKTVEGTGGTSPSITVQTTAPGAGTTTTPSIAGTPEDENLDGCDVSVEDVTSDEQLPAAEGGVQS